MLQQIDPDSVSYAWLQLKLLLKITSVYVY
jgi:hypothetical protein